MDALHVLVNTIGLMYYMFLVESVFYQLIFIVYFTAMVHVPAHQVDIFMYLYNTVLRVFT